MSRHFSHSCTIWSDCSSRGRSRRRRTLLLSHTRTLFTPITLISLLMSREEVQASEGIQSGRARENAGVKWSLPVLGIIISIQSSRFRTCKMHCWWRTDWSITGGGCKRIKDVKLPIISAEERGRQPINGLDRGVGLNHTAPHVLIGLAHSMIWFDQLDKRGN